MARLRKYLRIFFTQLFVHSPINFRLLFPTKSSLNPKGVGLLLSAYCNIHTQKLLSSRKRIEFLGNWLLSNQSKNYSGSCWGYNFDWQNRNRFSKRGTPTIVNTAFIAHSLIDAFEVTGKKRFLEAATSTSKFILNDINISKKKEGICFSYTPNDYNLVHNANVLGASILARIYSLTGQSKLLDYSTKAIEFTIAHQEKDGRWNYSINNGIERSQIDWHQGFIIDSICDYVKYTDNSDKKFKDSISKGLDFYKNKQFLPDGRCKWRYPRLWPIDIHNQAQGIITFSKSSLQNKDNLDFSKKICLWTISNMQHKSGFFYYQKWPLYSNKISYMRWSQAWMLLGLSELLNSINELN